VPKPNLFQGSEKQTLGREQKEKSLHSVGLRLSARDNEILDALSHRVRVFSVAQVARTWWGEENRREAQRRLETLEAAGLVHLYRVLSHPEIPLEHPEACWCVGEPAPDFGKLSYRLKARWSLPPSSVHCVIGSVLCGRSRGGSGGRYPRESEQVHDLHMAAVFLLYRKRDKSAAETWRSEASILRARGGVKGERLPDAEVNLNGAKKFVEFGGAYSKRKLEDFHDYCESIETDYEVW
jgi:hypothetical protein